MKFSLIFLELSILVAAILAAPAASPESAKMRQKRGLEDTAVSAGETMSSGCNNGADTAIAFADKAPIPGIDMFKTGVQVANTVCSGVQIAGQAVLADGAKKIDEISGVNAGKEESESSESDDS